MGEVFFDGQLWHRVTGARFQAFTRGEKPEGPRTGCRRDNYEWPTTRNPVSKRGTTYGDQSEGSATDSAKSSSGNSPAMHLKLQPSRAEQSISSNDLISLSESVRTRATPSRTGAVCRRKSRHLSTDLQVVGNVNVHRGEALTVEGSARQ